MNLTGYAIYFIFAFFLHNATAMDAPGNLKQYPQEKQKRIQDILSKIKREEPVLAPKKGFLIAEMKQQFPNFFQGVPAQYEQSLVNYANKIYPTDTLAHLNAVYKKGPIEIRAFRWQALGNYFGFDTKYDGNAVFFAGNLLKGIQSNINVREYNELAARGGVTPQARARALDELVGIYKIHLMPKGSLTDIILQLIDALKKDPELGKLLYKFKVRPNPDLTFNGTTLAAVIVYPANGKDNAQKALNKIYALFKNVPGTGIAPRYNSRVTDLIWIAQGDGDYKSQKYENLYEKERVYYHPNITGARQNYHLINPGTGKEIL